MSGTALATTTKPNVNSLLAKVGDRSLNLGERIQSVGDVMRAMSAQMMAALPKHLTPDRMIRVALNALRKNPKLLDCTAASLFGAITEAATYGWEIGGYYGHAYLVPYGNEVVLVPGYKGLIDLCRRSGQISTITMEVVHKCDAFSYSLGDSPKILHTPADDNPGRDKEPITYVYAVVRLRDGGIQRSVWSQQRIDAHKEQYSKAWKGAETSYNGKPAKKDSFWHTAWPAAAKKTVIRDMINRGLLPVSAEYRDAVDRGIKHDADDLDYSGFDLLAAREDDSATIEGDAGERPETGDEPNQDLIELARTDIAAATDDPGVDFAADELLAKATDEATRTAINGLRRDRKAALQTAANPKKQRQNELVK